MSTKLSSILFQQTDVRILSMLRIITGLWFFTDYFIALILDWVGEEYIDPQMHFPFIGFEWVKPLPGIGMYVLFVVVCVAALGVMTGYRYRFSLVVFLIGHLYVFLIDIVYNLNKSYLFLLLGALLLFVDAHADLSLDVQRKPQLAKRYVPRWNLLIFQFMLGLIYTFSGISKLNGDWLFNRQPMHYFLGQTEYLTALGDVVFEVVVCLFTYGGVLFDLSILWLLVNRRTNLIANVLQSLFHMINLVVLQIGSLSLYMIGATLILFPTSWIKRKLNIYPLKPELTLYDDIKRKRVVFILVTFACVQLLLPFRHLLTGNNVNWTEKGHRFSWRLMTRTKSGSTSTFYLKDKKTAATWSVNPRDYLTSRQYYKMSAETDLVLVFAYFLEEEWKKKGFEEIEVRAEVRTRLNRREMQFLVPPDVNLLKQQRTFIFDQLSTHLEFGESR